MARPVPYRTARVVFVAGGLLAVLFLWPAPAPAADKAAPPPYDWGVAYYMSYDNNLDGNGPKIIRQIRRGVTSPRTVAAVQADFRDPGGMHRYTITSAGMDETRLVSDDSADEDEAIAYLDWFVQTFRCKRYIVVFMDHGGRLDQMCLDDHPDTKGKHWMSGRVLGAKLRQFKERVPGRWELLFLQQCGRGSLENLYSFRGTADFVLSSPLTISAPQSYFTALHQWLGETPEATGEEVAARISAVEEGYTVYTCVRTAKLEELPRRLDVALEPFVSCEKLSAPDRPPVIYHSDGLVDLKVYLERLARGNRAGGSEVTAFWKWVRDELCAEVRFHKKKAKTAERLCGLSFYVPATQEEAERYRQLDLYKDSRLAELWKKLVPAVPVAPK
jgi:hypothetical protein